MLVNIWHWHKIIGYWFWIKDKSEIHPFLISTQLFVQWKSRLSSSYTDDIIAQAKVQYAWWCSLTVAVLWQVREKLDISKILKSIWFYNDTQNKPQPAQKHGPFWGKASQWCTSSSINPGWNFVLTRIGTFNKLWWEHNFQIELVSMP